jgi:hypothetical protein
MKSSARSASAWRFEPTTLVLALYIDERYLYEIDLEQCTTSAEMLDWIFQIAGKPWASDRVIAALVRLLDVLLDPHGRICSGSDEHGPIDVKRILARCA